MSESDEWYLDQAAISWGGGAVVATYTPLGIRQMDTGYCERLLRAKTLDEVWEVAAEIAENRHLHKTIKRNLLDNANRIELEMTPVTAGT